ncbi:MAG: ABC transporter substrate-binding protein [Bacteroidota bacterium]
MHSARRFYTAGAVALALAPLFLLSACGPNDPASLRAEQAEAADGDLVVGVAWPWSARTVGLYAEGLDMAVEEINADGGVNGRPVRLVRGDDGESVNEGRLVAQRFADDPEVVAVIGHLNSHVSIPAADIYERGGLLMLTPASTAPALTRKGYSRIFRSVHDDEEVGREMVSLAQEQGWRRVYVVYVRNAYGEGLASAFESAAAGANVDVVGRESYGSDGSGLDELVEDVRQRRDAQGFDAVFLAGVPPEAGQVISALRKGGVGAPVFGGDALDTAELVASAGGAAEGVYVASVFHPDDPRPEAQAFRQAFEARYGRAPDSWAARGYEAVRVLAQAMEVAGSAAPEKVAVALRESGEVRGITGPFGFDEKGDVVGKRLVTAVVRDGRFEFHGTGALASETRPEVPVVRTGTAE